MIFGWNMLSMTFKGFLELFHKLHDDVQNIHEELVEYINTPNWNRPIVYYDDDDDEDYTIAITPVLSTKEPVDSLIMEDEHLDTIPAKESDEVIKSSVEDNPDSGSPTSYLNLSLPDYEAFFCDSEPDSGNFTMDVVEDIFDNPTKEPRVHVTNVLPTHPTFQLDSDFTLSSDSLRSDLVVSFPSGTRNKIFDPGIFIEVQSKRFLSPNEFSISFIRDPLSPMFDTLLPFLSKNEDNVFNLGILASNEEKSPHLLSHRGFKTSKLFHHKSPLLIHRENIPILDVSFLHFYPP
ncbi:hypothetical protein Tco_1133059 [Tanacetum coccineum]|uniref:Reverse transcriptase domain-containing protein n=1 Tax=Tanacetum coccineum TaxID=301880 RepID=A0ABQ5JGK3_9ASTR